MCYPDVELQLQSVHASSCRPGDRQAALPVQRLVLRAANSLTDIPPSLLLLLLLLLQAKLCEEVALALGFDTNKGRLDVSVHPFTGQPLPWLQAAAVPCLQALCNPL